MEKLILILVWQQRKFLILDLTVKLPEDFNEKELY